MDVLALETTEYLPTPEEEGQIHAFEENQVDFVRRFVESTGFSAEVTPVGSVPKDTFLRGASDVDIFVVSEHYRELFKKFQGHVPEGHVKLGELLIWNYRKNGFEVDMVFISPSYPKIDTLRHTSFYKRLLTPEMKSEIRKAKALFISYGVYKAEIGGITGVAIEELIRLHRSVSNVCKLFLEAIPSDLWIQDPTTERPRNLLASINPLRWKQIQGVCREYLREPVVHLRPFTPESFRERHSNKIIVKCNRQLDKATDFQTAYSLCHKSGRALKNVEKDTTYFCGAFVEDTILVAIQTAPKLLSSHKEVCIPSELTDAIHAFKEAHPTAKLYEKNTEVCAVVPRTIVNAESHVTSTFIGRMADRGYVCSVAV